MNGELKLLTELRDLQRDLRNDAIANALEAAVTALSPTPAPGALPELPPLPKPFDRIERSGMWNGAPREGFDDVFDDDQMHAYARAYAEQCRAGVAELLAALREDMARPFSLILNYREQRRPNEPEGIAWWRWKRKQLEDAGYSMSHEFDNGEELFTRDGYTDRLTAALQSAFADDEGVKT